MQDPPKLVRLLSDAQEVSRSLQRLRKRSQDIVEAGRREPTSPWSGKPRCAALATSVGLRDPRRAGSTWLETAATCRQAADAWERLARLTAGWGWRKPWLVGTLWGSLLGLLLRAAATLPAHLPSGW